MPVSENASGTHVLLDNVNYPERVFIQSETDSKYLIDINSCSIEELESLPGIGAKLAERIIAYREEHPFKRKEDIMFVPGIGINKYEKIKYLVTVGAR